MTQLITLDEVVAMQHQVASAFDWQTAEEQYWNDAAEAQAFEIQAENAWLYAAENNEEHRRYNMESSVAF
jgi:hypothetical protein